MTITENHLKQAREIVKLLQETYHTNGYVGVEIDYPFQNVERYTKDYTIIHCLFENILDEITILTENLKYGNENDFEDLTKIETKSHAKRLKKFVKENSKRYFKGNEVHEYIKQVSE